MTRAAINTWLGYRARASLSSDDAHVSDSAGSDLAKSMDARAVPAGTRVNPAGAANARGTDSLAGVPASIASERAPAVARIGTGSDINNLSQNIRTGSAARVPASVAWASGDPGTASRPPIVSAPGNNDAFDTNPAASGGVANFSGNFTIGTTTPAAGGTGTPASGDALYFGTSSTTTLNNDLAAGTVFAGLTFNSGASAFTIGGNAFTLSAGITNNSTVNQTINNAVTLSADQSWLAGTAGGTTLTLGGSVTGAGINLTTNGGTAGPQVSSNTVFSGAVSLGSLVAQGNSNNGPNYGSNPTTTFNGSSTLTLTGNVVIGRSNVTFAGNAVANIGGSITNAGAASADWANLTIQDSASVTAGSVNMAGNNVTGNLTLNGGTLTTGSIAGIDGESGTYRVRMHLNGTQIIASQSNASFLTVTASTNGGVSAGATTTAFVGNGGALFNSNGYNIGITAILANDTGATGILTKSGVGTLSLTGANTYTGVTTVSGGTLQLGSGGTTGTLSTSSAIVDNGTFAVNRSNAVLQGTDFSGAAITGTGGFTQAGTGTTTLNAANTYTGLTLVNAGTLSLTGSLTSAVTVNSGGTLTGFGNGTTTGMTTGSLTVAGGGVVTLAQGTPSTPLTVGGGLTLGGTGSYGAGQYATLNFTLGNGVEALNASGALTLNSGGAYVNLIGATSTGTYNLLTFSSQTGAGAFSLSSTTAGVTSAMIGRNTYTLLDNATSLQLQVSGAAVPGVAYFNGAVSSTWNDLSSNTAVNFSSNLAGTTDAGNIVGVTTDVILNASNAPSARTASETLGTSTTINSLRVNGNGTTTLAADGSTLTINALADSNTASDGSFSGNAAGTGISIASGANAFTISVPVVLGNTQTWTNNSASLFTVGGSSVTGTATTGNTQTLTLANTGAGGITVSAVIGDGSAGGTLALAISNTGTGTTTLTGANTYTGGTTITAGTLQVNGTGALGTGNIVDNGTLVFNLSSAQTLNAIVSGSGMLTESGTGSLTLNGNNTFTGNIAINDGMTLNTNNGTGNLGAGTVTLGSTVGGSGTLVFNNNNNVTYATNFVLNGGSISSYDGDVHMGTATSTIAVNGATSLNRQYGHGGTQKKLSLDGIVTGSGALTLNGIYNPYNEGGGVLIGNNANTYSGTITVNSTSGSGMALIDGGNTALQFATVNVQGNGSPDVPYGLRFNPGVTAPVLASLQGSGNVLLQDLSNTSIVLTVGGNNADVTYSGVLSGTGGLTKAGTGAMTLNTADSYTGPTTVSGGTLNVPGSLPSSAVNVNGGTLNLTGTLVGSAVTVNSGGTFTEGTTGVISGAGSLTTFNNTALATTNTYTGATTVGGGTLTLTKAGSAPDPNNGYLTTGGTLAGTSGFTVNTGGTLVLGVSNSVSSGAATSGTGNGGTGVTLSGGMLTLVSGVTQGQGSTVTNGTSSAFDVPGLGNLTLTAASTINYAGSSGTVVFNGLTLNGNALTIGGTHFATLLGNSADGTTDRLIVESDAGPLSATDLALITFPSYGNSPATEIDLGDSFYEIIPLNPVLVPEPSTWAMGIIGLAALGCVVRRRDQGFAGTTGRSA